MAGSEGGWGGSILGALKIITPISPQPETLSLNLKPTGVGIQVGLKGFADLCWTHAVQDVIEGRRPWSAAEGLGRISCFEFESVCGPEP